MIVEAKKRSVKKTYGEKFKDLRLFFDNRLESHTLRENIKTLGENVKLLEESVKMFYNIKKAKSYVGVRPKHRYLFQFSKFIPRLLLFCLIFMISSGSVWAAAGDIDSSGTTDGNDLEILVNQWLQSPGTPSADIAPESGVDGVVNFLDFALLAKDWKVTDRFILEDTLF